jgi:ribonuclease HI
VGIGIVAINQNRVIHEEMINIGNSQIVYNGELQGVIQGTEYIDKIARNGYLYRIFTDNQAGIYRLKRPSDNPGQDCQIRAITAAKSILAKGAKIEIHWSPGYTDIYGNELADSLAKAATLQKPTLNQTSFAVLGLKTKKLKRLEWGIYLNTAKPTNYSKRFTWNIKSKISVPISTKRELASAFYQLKFGHGYIKSYLYRLKHIGNDKCACGQRETTEHLLLSCRNLKEARKGLKNELNGVTLNLSLLFHTKIGILKTLEFLQKPELLLEGGT